MRRSAIHAAQLTLVAALLLRAQATFACPVPPENSCTPVDPPITACSFEGSSDLEVSIPAVNLPATRDYGWGGVNVCDAMVLLKLSDITVNLRGEAASVPLRNLQIADVVRLSTTPDGAGKAPVRFGSGALCLWASENNPLFNAQQYQVTVQAWDPDGNLHQGQTTVVVNCTEPGSSESAPTAFYLKVLQNEQYVSNANYCTESTACLAMAERPESCTDQCNCSPICIPSEGHPCGSTDDGGTNCQEGDPNCSGGTDGGTGCQEGDPNCSGGGTGGTDGGTGGTDGGITCYDGIPDCGQSAGNGTTTTPTTPVVNGGESQQTGAGSQGGCNSLPAAGSWAMLALLGTSLALRRRR